MDNPRLMPIQTPAQRAEAARQLEAWGASLPDMASNFVPDAMGTVSDFADMAMHPIDTIRGFVNLGEGIGQQGRKALGLEQAPTPQMEAAAQAGQELVAPLQSEEAFRQDVTEHPFDTALAFVPYGKLGKAAKFAKGSKQAAKIAEALDGGEIVAHSKGPPGGRIPGGIQGAADRAELASIGKRMGELNIPPEQRGAVSTLLGAYKSTAPGRILSKIEKEGGYSVHVPTGNVPTSGLFSGIYRNENARTTVRPTNGPPLTREDVLAFNRRNAKKLNEGLDYHLGGWREDATGTKYLDVAKRFPENQLRQATKFAEGTAQKKIFRRSDYAELPVGNWRDFIHSDAYKQRVLDAYHRGALHMSGKTPWWELPEFEQIYGKERMQQVKGLLAATSSNTAPRANVATATEYLRRLINNEPIIQPNFRVPANAMGVVSGPGKKLFEGSRVPNLRAAVAEQPLSGEVVREKMEAMGAVPGVDPRNAPVMDRVQTYPAEDPASGVYATGRKGYGPPAGDLREEWRNVYRDLAQQVGVDPATFGERSWVGFREATGRKGMGSSHGYNDQIVDLIQSKAAHLGITIDQMKALLSAGKGELLVKALGLPMGAAAAYGAASSEPSPQP